jgi:uncharacterized protein DUF4241
MAAGPDPEALPYIIAFMVVVTAGYVAYRLWSEGSLRFWRRGRRIGVPGQPGFVAPTGERTRDLVALFTDGKRDDATIEVKRVASLYLPTGKIVACDPLVNPDTEPFTREVPVGTYPVDASVARFENQTRVAALRIVFAPGTPVRWELALLPNQDPQALEPGETFGYGVDAGLGCFMDASTRALILERGDTVGDNYYEVLAPELDGDFTDHHPIEGRAENCAIAYSGWGDGIYASYWGFDADGNVLWLVTDFALA